MSMGRWTVLLAAGFALPPLLAGLLAAALAWRAPFLPSLPWAALVLAAATLAGGPAACVAAMLGASGRPALSPFGLGAALALGLGIGGALVVLDAAPPLAIAAGLCAGGLAAMAAGLAPSPGAVTPALAVSAAGALAVTGLALPGAPGLLAGIGAAATVLGLAGASARATGTRRRAPWGASSAAGLGLALAVLAPGFGLLATDAAPLAAVLGMVAALPGLCVLMAPWPAPAPIRAAILLAVQAMAVGLLLPAVAMPTALGLLPLEATEAFRWALLGAAFLPAFCALAGAALARGQAGGALVLWLLAALWAGLPPLAGPAGLLLAPLLAMLPAALLAFRTEAEAHAARA
jgi:hypothetical protein